MRYLAVAYRSFEQGECVRQGRPRAAQARYGCLEITPPNAGLCDSRLCHRDLV
jgi:hypothetical protein